MVGLSYYFILGGSMLLKLLNIKHLSYFTNISSGYNMYLLSKAYNGDNSNRQ